MLHRRGNRGLGSASDRLTRGCGGRGEDSHSQREDTEEMHLDVSESVGSEFWIGWLRLVENGEDEDMKLQS